MPQPALLCCRDISKSFDGRALFSGLQLTIERGESVAILGESGTGKSTLLHILAGLEAPDCGQILLNDQSLWSVDASLRNRIRRQTIGLVFQAFYLIPHLSARQNIALPWILDGRKADTDRVNTLLERMGLSHRADALPAQLSGGEQQRVAIARALALSPGLILADEPTGNLDPRNAAEVLGLLTEQVTAHGHSLIMVTHSSRAAERMGRRMTLESGQLVDTTT